MARYPELSKQPCSQLEGQLVLERQFPDACENAFSVNALGGTGGARLGAPAFSPQRLGRSKTSGVRYIGQYVAAFITVRDEYPMGFHHGPA